MEAFAVCTKIDALLATAGVGGVAVEAGCCRCLQNRNLWIYIIGASGLKLKNFSKYEFFKKMTFWSKKQFAMERSNSNFNSYQWPDLWIRLRNNAAAGKAQYSCQNGNTQTNSNTNSYSVLVMKSHELCVG